MKGFLKNRQKMMICFILLCFLTAGQGLVAVAEQALVTEQNSYGNIASLVDQGISPAVVSIEQDFNIILPNSKGFYPRLNLKESSEIHASVFFPEALPGESIQIFPEDGGQLKGQATSGVVVVDSANSASFRFRPLDFEGLYRISLYRGGDRKILQFWVGSFPESAN